MIAQISLRDFTPEHIGLLKTWLLKDHVKPWYPEPESSIDFAQNLPPNAGHFLICSQERPIGYLRWQLVSREILDSVGLTHIPDNSADVDLLIGERAEICHGAGPAALNILEDFLSKRGDVPLIGLTSSSQNHFAHKAFEKVNFEKVATYSPEGFGECYLFTKKLSVNTDRAV